jgi:hypothetical protein
VRAGINVGEFPPIGYFAAKSPQSAGLQTVEIKQFQIITAVAFFCPFVSAKGRKPFAQTMARATLKTQEILAKKWALLRTSPNGPRAVFAGFLCVFKFTGSAAPRLGGLARCVDIAFCFGKNIF